MNNENCICEFINTEYLEFDNEMVSTTCRHLNDTEIKIGDICPEGTCYLNGCQDEALEYIENHLVQPLIISCFIGMIVYSLGLISIFGLIKQVIFQYYIFMYTLFVRHNLGTSLFSNRDLGAHAHVLDTYFQPFFEMKQKSK